MKKILLTTIASVWLFTGAMCGNVDLTQLVKNAQADAVQICAFLPDVETITAIFAVGNPAVQSGAAIAAAICAAVTPHAALAPTATPDGSITGAVVVGIPVKGHFVVK